MIYQKNNIVRINPLSPAKVANALDSENIFAATGTDTYSLTSGIGVTAYTNLDTYKIKFPNASTGACTFNVDGIGAKKIYKTPTVQAGIGDIVANSIYDLVYDSSLDSSAGGFLIIGGVATQAETNTGTDDLRIVTPLKLKNKDADAGAITDASSMDITGPKHTLTTSSATRTFTISHTGDDITLVVTLSAVSSVFTFPAAALCVSEGVASGDNTLSLAGVSGDKYVIGIKKVGSSYYVASKNFGQ